ncbi:hypothetical protein JK207_04625 [Gluconobacter cerinus]|uniref:MotE family protein n=1 Tax=Gluconobacter TaxID=441 RepID=UPI001B8C09F4|nr:MULTISPECIES: hypothetical protein [Gluconobacter]MBS0993390.1 hypothetical protein [Gluconobacter cerinus]MBS1021325.1 hypothetical protein [Gluconobacter cerinus]
MLFRLLHIACGLMIILLGVKVYDLVGYVDASTDSSLMSSAMAQPAATQVVPKAAADEAVSKRADAGDGKAAQQKASSSDLCKAGGCQGTLSPTGTVDAITPDPTLKAELAARQQELDRKAAALEDRQRLVDAAEEELQRRMTALQTSRSQFEETARHSDELLNQDAERLVRIYEAMKPVDAAAIFNILDLRVGVGLLNRMSPRKASAIMEAMSPQRAILATQLLANAHAHPGMHIGDNG